MKEYIDRAALKQEFAPYEENDFSQQMDVILAIVDAQPASDVVEVVRCDYCERHYEEDGEYFCSRTDMPCADDDFCSHGARMDKEDEHGS